MHEHSAKIKYVIVYGVLEEENLYGDLMGMSKKRKVGGTDG